MIWKLSDVIEVLEEARERYGDLPIVEDEFCSNGPPVAIAEFKVMPTFDGTAVRIGVVPPGALPSKNPAR